MIARQLTNVSFFATTPRAAMTVALEDSPPFGSRVAAIAVLNASAPCVFICFAFVVIILLPLFATSATILSIGIVVFSDNSLAATGIGPRPFGCIVRDVIAEIAVCLIAVSALLVVFVLALGKAGGDRSTHLTGVRGTIFSLVGGFLGAQFCCRFARHGEFSERGRCAGRLSVGALAGHLNICDFFGQSN